jgi:thioredoxin reductase (NADPH)
MIAKPGERAMRAATIWARDTDIIRDPAGYLITGPDLLDAGKPSPVWNLESL